ncbi:TlpA family protein disulfide reductase [Odoribacter splanchnicus]|nr:TlpA family protein disulfide reductase [Odoribacter splanchnicus]
MLQVGADALASKTVYPVNSQAQQQIALIGREIPDFCYRDSTGKEVKFSSFRGNYVYVDMWATWCRPCCEEIPYMGELEKKFHGKKICFVSLSCDKDLQAWKKKLRTDRIGGIQLNCGGDPAFMKFFGIQGIPHFILLDPEGKVVNPNMSRPSQEITVETLSRLKGI